MRPGSPEFEQRLSARVRAEVRASPALREEHDRARKARRVSLWTAFIYLVTWGGGGPLLLLGVPLMFFVVTPYMTGGSDLALGVAGLTQLCGAFAWASWLQWSLFASPNRSALGILPICDTLIARLAWRRVLPYSVLFLWLAALAYGYVGWRHVFALPGWLVAGALVVLNWIATVALGTLLVGVRPAWPYPSIARGSVILAFGSLVWVLFLKTDALSTPLLVATPGGWVGAALEWGYMQGIRPAWLFLIPVALVVGSALRAWRWAESWFTAGEPVSSLCPEPASGPHVAACDGAVWSVEQLVALSASPSSDEMERTIRSRAFLTDKDRRPKGWFEQLVSRWLSGRQWVVVNFMSNEQAQWMEYWRGGICLLGVAIMLTMFPFGNLRIPAMMLVISVYLVLCIGGPWPGFRLHYIFGSFVPHYAVLPLGFDEVFRGLLKVSLLRLGAVAPFTIAAGAFEDWWLQRGAAPACLGAVELCLLASALQPWLIVLRFCGGMRDPGLQRRNAWMILMASLLLLAGIIGVGVAGVGIMATVRFGDGPFGRMALPVFATGVCIVGATSTGAWLFYRRLHAGGRIDLLPARPSDWTDWPRQSFQNTLRRERYAAIARKYGPWWWLRRGYWTERRLVR